MHEHDFKPYKIEETNEYYYSKCECGAIQGSAIESSEEKGLIINYLATHVGNGFN